VWPTWTQSNHRRKKDGGDFRESVGGGEPDEVGGRAAGTERSGSLAERAEKRFYVLEKFLAAHGAKGITGSENDESGETGKNDEKQDVGAAAGKSDKNFYGGDAEEDADGHGNAEEAGFTNFFVGEEAELLEIGGVIETGGAAFEGCQRGVDGLDSFEGFEDTLFDGALDGFDGGGVRQFEEAVGASR
jgi:hypothetical protein